MEMLMILLKIIEDNIKVLHRNIIGQGWFETHEVLEDYYKELDSITDDVMEIGIGLGYQEPTIASICEMQQLPYPGLPQGVKYDCKKAYEFVYNYFTSIIEAIDAACKGKDLPNDVKGKLQEYQYWFRKEAEFKIKARMSK